MPGQGRAGRRPLNLTYYIFSRLQRDLPTLGRKGKRKEGRAKVGEGVRKGKSESVVV